MDRFAGVWKPEGDHSPVIAFLKEKAANGGVQLPENAPSPDMFLKMKDKITMHIKKEGEKKFSAEIKLDGHPMPKKQTIEIGKDNILEPFPGFKEKVTVTLVDDNTLEMEEVNCKTGAKSRVVRKLIDDNTMLTTSTMNNVNAEAKFVRISN